MSDLEGVELMRRLAKRHPWMREPYYGKSTSAAAERLMDYLEKGDDPLRALSLAFESAHTFRHELIGARASTAAYKEIAERKQARIELLERLIESEGLKVPE